MRLGTTAYLCCYRVAHCEGVAVQLASTGAMPAERRASSCRPFPFSSTAGFASENGRGGSFFNNELSEHTQQEVTGHASHTHLTPTPALSVLLQSTRLPYASAQCVPAALE